MAKEYISMRNLRFLLYEVFDAESLTQYPLYQDHSKETYEMMLDAMKQMCDTLFFPTYEEMDKNPPHFEDGKITVHENVRKIMQAFGEGGWINGPLEYDRGGQQMPIMIYNAAQLICHASNTSAAAYPYLTAGASNLIETFGTDELKETFLPNMYAGKWQGTMALTEPHAGSSLGDIYSTATPTDEGHYLIKGQKIFISGGDSDAVDNVVHLYLAKIDGAPAGSRGISLFAVPKYRVENGELVWNDVTTGGKEEKLGIKGCPIAHLITGENGDCHGYLVGEPNKGLVHMFLLMNEARLGVGMISTGVASAAYYASLEYANERPQGRALTERDPETPQTLIINHADVKRMLLLQKAVVEGSAALLTECSKYIDMTRVTEGEEAEKWEELLGLLTPIAKSYPAEMGILSTSAGLQCLGGAGFCSEFPLQQHYRDMRINPIYEGTTGIQALDLLGRKVPYKMGATLMVLGQEMQATIEAGKAVDSLRGFAEQLEKAQQDLTETTMYLMTLAQKDAPEVFLADATLYLEMAGHITIAWQWLKMGVAAAKGLEGASSDDEKNFYQGKLHTLHYFYGYELPKIAGLKTRLMDNDKLTVDMAVEYLN